MQHQAVAVAEYLGSAPARPLPQPVGRCARHHLLDTLAAIVAGSRLAAGHAAARYVEMQQHAGGLSTVVGTSMQSSPMLAALANGMSAHADESDDSHPRTAFHPGASIVPAALALGESRNACLDDLLRAVTAGYDVGCRVNLASGDLRNGQQSFTRVTVGGTFGAGAASCLLLGFGPQEILWVLSYLAQQSGGVNTWQRDHDHVEKAFVFAGMPARDGVAAAEMVAAGFTGVNDALTGSPNFFDKFGDPYDLTQLSLGLGERFEICETDIKKYAVGGGLLLLIQAVESIVDEHGCTAETLDAIEVRLPVPSVPIFRSSAMPELCAEFQCAITLVDGGWSYAASHDKKRMSDPEVERVMRRVSVVGDESLTRARAAIVTVRDRAGTYTAKPTSIRGSATDPMSEDELSTKATDLMTAVIGDASAARCVELVLHGSGGTPIREIAEALCTSVR